MAGDVLCLSHLRWSFVYQRPNHLMSRCAKTRRVFYVEEPLFDATKPHLVTHKNSDGVTIALPHLPRHLPHATPRTRAAALRRLVDRLLVSENIRDPLLWFYTPMALTFAGHIRGHTTVYDCMDELSLFKGAPPELVAYEAELFRRADIVFTGGHSLYEAKRARHPRVHAFPSSVDATHFGRARNGSLAVPEDEAKIPTPRIGYFGVVDERLDLPLLAQLADAHSRWHIVIVGPTAKIDARHLPRRPNLHYLGPKKYEELPAHVGAWDVAIMPFADNEATRFISPTKTLEYLAAGKSVVSTPIRDVARPYGEAGLVRIGVGDGFVAAVADALANRGSDVEAERRRAADALVAETSWDRTWARMDALIEETASSRRVQTEAKAYGG